MWADEQREPLVLDPGPSSGETQLLSPSSLSFSVWTMFSAPWCLNPPVLLAAQEKILLFFWWSLPFGKVGSVLL